MILFSEGHLSSDYYKSTCPNVERVVRSSLRRAFLLDPSAPASLLRLSFHDCQVEKCDASILLDSVSNDINGERESGGNFGIRRLDIIDRVKQDLEKECPGVVSCADIVAMAGRDAVSYTGGPEIPIPLGRKDATTASSENADDQLPPASSTVSTMLQVFSRYGMTAAETVGILGAHTLGIGHCVNVVDRLYPTRDPALSTGLYLQLRVLCPTKEPLNLTILPNDLSVYSFDNRYFKDVLGGRGLFRADANLVGDARTKPLVAKFASDQSLFFKTFASAYVKLVSAQVLTGSRGEVRTNCRRVNAQD